MAKITAWAFGQMLVEAGVLTKERLGNTARIVIDAKGDDGTVTLYVQEYGDSEALARLAPMLKGILDDG
jgi:hypothetical protein